MQSPLFRLFSLELSQKRLEQEVIEVNDEEKRDEEVLSHFTRSVIPCQHLDGTESFGTATDSDAADTATDHDATAADTTVENRQRH